MKDLSYIELNHQTDSRYFDLYFGILESGEKFRFSLGVRGALRLVIKMVIWMLRYYNRPGGKK